MASELSNLIESELKATGFYGQGGQRLGGEEGSKPSRYPESSSGDHSDEEAGHDSSATLMGALRVEVGARMGGRMDARAGLGQRSFPPARTLTRKAGSTHHPAAQEARAQCVRVCWCNAGTGEGAAECEAPAEPEARGLHRRRHCTGAGGMDPALGQV